jgi:hypothetical protein
MKSLISIVAAVILASGLPAHARDVRSTFNLLKKGNDLSAKEAEKLEERAKKNPNDEEARVQLLSYYAAVPMGTDLSIVKAAREKHILWLIENDPKEGLGLFQVATGVYRVHCEGDDLADPNAFKRIAEMWLEQLKKNPENAQIRSRAVDAIQFCSPEQAEQILTEAKDGSGLGRLYASAILGTTGESYRNNDPTGSNLMLRERPFARKARQVLEVATDKDLLVAAAGTLLRDGAIMWADGTLDWDYTPIGNDMLAKAKRADPDALTLLTLPTTLPARGERPPSTLRIGGNVQAAQLIRKYAPPYPPNARAAGIQGTVRMTALVGLDGKILFLHPDSGPPELIPASTEAVSKWEYKPTMLNGKPCYVVTLIDVNFTLSPQ